MDILIVDDEKDLCNILTLFCVRKNFTVSCAFSIQDALAQVDSLPTLIFLDHNLSDGSGLDAVKQLKARAPRSKIVFITASSDHKIRDQAFQRGVDYFLSKPFQLQGVREILSQIT